MDVIWKDIKGYEGLYQVSNLGNVKSLIRNIILKPDVSTGYNRVRLTKRNGSKRKLFQIHQLVAVAFLNHKIDGYNKVIDHIDENPLNNNVNNLRIVSQRDNIINYVKNNNKGFLLGVEKVGCKYRANIGVKYDRVHFKVVECPILAHNMYILATENLSKYKNKKQFKELINNLI